MLTVSDDKNTVTVSGDIPQAAKTKALEKQTVIDNLTKLGNTPYYCEDITLKLDDGLFVAASALNALRRDAIEQLDKKRAEVNLNEYTVPNFDGMNSLNGKKQFIARFAGVDQIPKKLGCIKTIILPYECEMPQIDGVENIAELPRYIGNEAVVIKRLESLKQQGITAAYCGNLSAVAMAKSLGFKVIGAVGLNANNNQTIKTLNYIGVDIQMLSAEISVKEIKSICSLSACRHTRYEEEARRRPLSGRQDEHPQALRSKPNTCRSLFRRSQGQGSRIAPQNIRRQENQVRYINRKPLRTGWLFYCLHPNYVILSVCEESLSIKNLK